MTWLLPFSAGKTGPFTNRMLPCLALVFTAAGCMDGVGEVNRRCNADLDCATDERCVDGTCESADLPREPEPSPPVNEPDVVEPSVVEPGIAEPDAVEPDPEPSFSVDSGTQIDGGPSPDVVPPDAGEDGGNIETDGGSNDDGDPSPNDGGNPLDAGPSFDGGALDAGVGDVDAGIPIPSDAFDAAWFDPTYSVRARYRLANGRGYNYAGFPLPLFLQPGDFHLNEFPNDEDAFRVTTETGDELPFHFERLSESNALVWVTVSIESGVNHQQVFVYLKTSGSTTPRPIGPVYDAKVLHAYHFRGATTEVVDFAGGANGVSDIVNSVSGKLGRGVSLVANTQNFPLTTLVGNTDPSVGGFSFWIHVDTVDNDEHLLFGNGVEPKDCIQVALDGEFIIARAYNGGGTKIAEAIVNTVRAGRWERYAVEWNATGLSIGNGRFTIDRSTFTDDWDGPIDQRVVFHPGAVSIDEFQVASEARGFNWSVAAYRAADDDFNLYETSPLPALAPEPSNDDVTPPNDPIVRYRFDETDGDVVHDSSGLIPSIDLNRAYGSHRWENGRLEIDRRTFFVSSVSTQRLRDAMIASEELSVEIWARSEHLLQSGPARIVTLSSSTSTRSFTAGQHSESWVMRLRTTETDSNGAANGTRTIPMGQNSASVSRELDHIVFVRTDNGKATTYVNGVVVEDIVWPGSFSTWALTDQMGIGNEIDDSSRTWTGSLSSFSLYDRALTELEIQTSFGGGSP